MIVWEQRLEYLQYAERILGVRFYDRNAVTWLTSIDSLGSIMGVVVFSRFTEGNCEVTVASSDPRFLTKSFLLAAVLYPFVQCDCRRVTAIIAVGNEKSLSLAQQLGFQTEGVLRNWFSSSDAYILGLLRESCKWLKESHGQPQRTAST